MSKRSDFRRRANDAYYTPIPTAKTIIPHLPEGVRYWEPCAGAGAIVKAVPGCVLASDTHPAGEGFLEYNIKIIDALTVKADELDQSNVTHIITNPPWTRQILHPMIDHFAAMRPTWLLFDADWAHTKQSAPFMRFCQKIVSIGRVSWMENGTSGKDNCAWYLFDKSAPAQTEFIGRAA